MKNEKMGADIRSREPAWKERGTEQMQRGEPPCPWTHPTEERRDEQPAVLQHWEWRVPDHVLNVVIETVRSWTRPLDGRVLSQSEATIGWRSHLLLLFFIFHCMLLQTLILLIHSTALVTFQIQWWHIFIDMWQCEPFTDISLSDISLYLLYIGNREKNIWTLLRWGKTRWQCH